MWDDDCGACDWDGNDDGGLPFFMEEINGESSGEVGIPVWMMEQFQLYKAELGEVRIAELIEFDRQLRAAAAAGEYDEWDEDNNLIKASGVDQLNFLLDTAYQKPFQAWQAVQSWEQDKKNEKKEIAFILKKYDYDLDKLQTALNAVNANVEKIQSREDWICDCYPTPQGFADASDLQNERIARASEPINGLEKAIGLLTQVKEFRGVL